MPLNSNRKPAITRRKILEGAFAGALLSGVAGKASGQTDAPIRLGMQVHRTGIGASYGRWYERVAVAAIRRINDMGGINGRRVEMIAEDDSTDPKRGAELIERFALLHQCDAIFGPLFSHVVIGSAPRAGELKIPYFSVSEGHHVASGMLSRYTFQCGTTEVKSQAQAMAPFVRSQLGRKASMIFPDYAFGHDHRDHFTAAFEALGGKVLSHIAIPPTASSYARYFPQVHRDTDVLYHVMVGPAVLTFVREMGEFFGASGPELFGFIDSLEAVDMASPGLEFLEGSHFWEGMPRYAQPDQTVHEQRYRAAVGVDRNGASVDDPRDVSTYAHMFGVWETLNVIKRAMEAAGYRSRRDTPDFIEAVEAIRRIPLSDDHPQGAKLFNGKTHQVFAHQNISRVGSGGRLIRVHRTSIAESLYPDEVDYTKRPL